MHHGASGTQVAAPVSRQTRFHGYGAGAPAEVASPRRFDGAGVIAVPSSPTVTADSCGDGWREGDERPWRSGPGATGRHRRDRAARRRGFRAVTRGADTEWFVYVLTSKRVARTYVGITTDPARRLEQHNGERAGGARATRAGRPWMLATQYGPFRARGEALRVECEVKKLRGRRRLSWRSDS
ncbi:MAG: GIY-YIG nuclease family protein [Myxococcota bacterium]